MDDADDADTAPPSRRSKFTQEQRLELLERDVRSHARSLTAIVEAGKKFSPEQMDQLRELLREEFADAGLRIDGPEHVDDARRDFMFLRAFRKGVNGTAAKIGWVVILAVLGAAGWLFTIGINAWKAGQ